jgi:hypothetical protein
MAYKTRSFTGTYTGPIHGATERNARRNMAAFRHALQERRLGPTSQERCPDLDDGEGRYGYRLAVKDRAPLEVLMPGTPLPQVRPGADAEPAQGCQRVYLNDSPWTWGAALDQFRAENSI